MFTSRAVAGGTRPLSLPQAVPAADDAPQGPAGAASLSSPADVPAQPAVFDLAADRPLRRPTLEQIGRLGTKLLGPDLPWLRRHVESVTLCSLATARRQLTIDVVLPEHQGCSFPWRDGEHLFYLPIALMLKQPPASNLDMRDERNVSLPVLNRCRSGHMRQVEHALRSLASWTREMWATRQTRREA